MAEKTATEDKPKTLYDEVVAIEKEYMEISAQAEELQKKQFATLQKLAPMQNRLLSLALKEAQDENAKLKQKVEELSKNMDKKVEPAVRKDNLPAVKTVPKKVKADEEE